MRLICPNCDANYEVDDAVIPEGGRDVQCSNCGHTWFQRSAEEELAPAKPEEQPEPEPTEEPEEAAEAAEVEVEEVAEDAPESEAEPAAVAESDAEDDTESDDDGADGEEAPRQELDEAVLNILRQEAEYESRARAQDGGADFETQEEMPLGGGSTDADPVAARTAKLRGEAQPITDPATRRDLLPDIEEINSTLRATSDRVEEAAEAAEEAPQPVRRSGFRRGFLIMILLFVIATCLYIYAPKIAEAVPALKGIMEGYVSWVNGIRIWLDGLMNSAVESMSGFTQDGG